MGLIDEATDFVEDVGDSAVGTVLTGGMNKVFAESSRALTNVTGYDRAQEAQEAAKNLKQAQTRLLEQRTLRQKRNQIRQARFGRAAAIAQQEISGIGGDSSVSATAESSLRSQLSANLASMRTQLMDQTKIAEAKEDIAASQQPSDLEFGFNLATKAFGSGLLG